MANVTVVVQKDNNIQSDRVRSEAAAVRSEEVLAEIIAPPRVVSVFTGASGEAPYYADFPTALAYASTLTPTKANPVLIKYFLPTPIIEDVYALFDLGIVVESSYDYWQKFMFFGGDLDLSQLLYTINLSRTNLEVKL